VRFPRLGVGEAAERSWDTQHNDFDRPRNSWRRAASERFDVSVSGRRRPAWRRPARARRTGFRRGAGRPCRL